MFSVPDEDRLQELDALKNMSKWSQNIEGVFMPKKFSDIQEKVSNWQVNEEDVWVVSFPKTDAQELQSDHEEADDRILQAVLAYEVLICSTDTDVFVAAPQAALFLCQKWIDQRLPNLWVAFGVGKITRYDIGTTWTQEMAWLLLNDLNYKGAEKNLLKRSPQLEATAMVRSLFLKFFWPVIPQLITDSLKYVKNQKTPACIKTHLPWNLLPKEIQKGIKKPKIIYINRNPKDTCVSYYHFSRLIKEFDGTLEEYCNLFLAGKLNFAPFWNHVLPFWKRRNDSNILFLKYEDLKHDLPAAIRKTAKFLEKDLTNEQVDKLADHLSFESMKNNPAVNYDWLVKLSKLFKPDKNNTFMRKGIVGGYKEAMTPEMIERFDKWTEENTRGTGLTYS